MDHAELTTEQVLKRDIPWETYMTTKLISGTGLQLLRRYDNRSESHRAQLLDDDGPSYVRVFVSILRDIYKEETVEYVLALIDEMLTGNWFIQEKSCKILASIVSARPKPQDRFFANGEASNSKSKSTTIDDVLKLLVEWLCAQLKKPSHPSRGVPVAINCLAALLKEPMVRSSFVQADGVKLLTPLISPASTQQSIQLLYETCLCVWLLSYYEPAVEYLATTRTLPRLIDVVKSSTKEKVVRVVVLILRNLLPKGNFAAQMIDLGLPQVVQSLKAQAWSDEDLLEGLNQLEEGLKDNIKRLSSFDKYKQEVLLGHLDWSPMHKDPLFWRDNITNFEENDFQILRVLLTILDTSSDPRALAVACFDLSQFIQYHPAGRVIVTDLKAKERTGPVHANFEALRYLRGAAIANTLKTQKNTHEEWRLRKEKEKEKEKEKVCKRCKQTYTASSNSSSSCRFHPSFFVCRRHDDQKRYYELGPDDPPYASKFYDCCGAEDPDASGCTTGFHVSYYELGPDDLPYAAKFYDCCGAEDADASGCTTGFHVSYDDD
ncbi:V-type proton ATPase subunit H [Citrus sinensis]|uniref:V-type proton ATPase subunit H n=1 Tax=Citrus sinensis TaxID=2711 RepID=A0ACB8LDS5_CITSI|nr:V-type proton ATPase subunit H [Citrus sinensis]